MQKNTLIGVIAIVVVFAGLLWVTSVGVDKNEVVECNTWKEQAAQYSKFFLTKWQDEQCRAHGIIINAPVR